MEDKKRKRKPNAWIQTLQINEYYCGAINPSEIFYHYGYIGGWWGMQTFSGWYFQKRKQFYFVELWLTFFHFRIINSKQSFTSLYFYFLFSRLGHFCYWNDWARKQFYRHEVVLKSSRLTHFTKCNQITKHQMSTFLLFPPSYHLPNVHIFFPHHLKYLQNRITYNKKSSTLTYGYWFKCRWH